MGMVHNRGNAVPFHGDHHPVKVATHRKSRNLWDGTECEIDNKVYSNRFRVNGTGGAPDALVTMLSDRAGETIWYSCKTTGTKSGAPIGQLRFYDRGVFIAKVDPDKSFVVPDNIGDTNTIVIYGSTNGATVKDYQLELGSVTGYEPYGLIEEPIFEPIDQAQDGKTLTFENTYNDVADVTVFGESMQDGEPTPEAPVPIESIKSVELVSRNADGSKSATRTIDLQGHELRSLPDGTHDELLVHRDGTVELVQRCDASMFDPSYPVSNEWKLSTPQTIQLHSIDPLPTYYHYTFVDGNGADISARVRVFE